MRGSHEDSDIIFGPQGTLVGHSCYRLKNKQSSSTVFHWKSFRYSHTNVLTHCIFNSARFLFTEFHFKRPFKQLVLTVSLNS